MIRSNWVYRFVFGNNSLQYLYVYEHYIDYCLNVGIHYWRKLLLRNEWQIHVFSAIWEMFLQMIVRPQRLTLSNTEC